MRAPRRPSRTSDARSSRAACPSPRPLPGSSGSSPTTTWNTVTASSTVRAIGPAMSASRFSGITPARLVRPIVERMPTSAWCDDGPRIELPVSDAEARGAEARRDRRRGAAARSGGHAIERVRVLGVAGKNRAQRLVGGERPFRHVRLGEHDGAGLLDALDLKRVLARNEIRRAPASRSRSAARWSRSCP